MIDRNLFIFDEGIFLFINQEMVTEYGNYGNRSTDSSWAFEVRIEPNKAVVFG